MVSYAPEAVAARLAQLGRESREHASPVRLDMSREAVTSRLDMLGALSALCASLGRARGARIVEPTAGSDARSAVSASWR